MTYYKVTMRHTEKTLEKLSHMQYDLFSGGNQMARTVISLAALITGVLNFSEWWGCLLLIYGSYMSSSKSASANHGVHKMVKQIKAAGLELPSSRYEFEHKEMQVYTLPEGTRLGQPLKYADVLRMAEDEEYFYLFRDERGGYMIPKKELGKEVESFRAFMKENGLTPSNRITPLEKIVRAFKKKNGGKKQSGAFGNMLLGKQQPPKMKSSQHRKKK